MLFMIESFNEEFNIALIILSSLKKIYVACLFTSESILYDRNMAKMDRDSVKLDRCKMRFQTFEFSVVFQLTTPFFHALILFRSRKIQGWRQGRARGATAPSSEA